MSARVHSIKEAAGAVCRFTTRAGSSCILRPAYAGSDAICRGDAAFFAQLRSENGDSFFDTALVDTASVLDWVARRYARDMRQINFIVEDHGNQRLGFFGISNISDQSGRAEFGRVMKAADAPRGLMKPAILALARLAKTDLGLDLLKLEVFAENDRALALYLKTGFAETGRHFRHLVDGNGSAVWRTVQSRNAQRDAREVIEMELDLVAKDFGANGDE